MKKETKFVNKIKRLLKRLGFPRWLHHFGPKKYEFYEHICSLLIKIYCKFSYRRTVYFLDLLGFKCPSKSALQYNSKKLRKEFWNKILRATSGDSYLVALDSTGFSRENPSYHYLKRIDGKMPKIPIKLSCAFDTRKKKFCSANVRVLPAHDVKDAEMLIKKSNPKIIVADKAYDSNKVHVLCNELGIKAHIPIREYGRVRHFHMSARRKACKHFRKRTYHRRELIESGFSALKRKFGISVSSKKASTIRSEVYGRLTCHNIFQMLFETFRTEPVL